MIDLQKQTLHIKAPCIVQVPLELNCIPNSIFHFKFKYLQDYAIAA